MYILTNRDFVLSEATEASIGILRDTNSWEQFTEADLQEHFNNVHALFVDRINDLPNQTTYLTPMAEKELSFIFETLLQAKLNLQERLR